MINKKLIERVKRLLKLMKENNITRTFKDDVKKVTLSYDYIPGENCPDRKGGSKCQMCEKCKFGMKRVYDIAIPRDYLKGIPDMREAEFEKYFGTEDALYYYIREEQVAFMFMAGPCVPRKKWWK